MVIGLDIVKIKTERKLDNKLTDSILTAAERPLSIIPLIIIAPNKMSTTELVIPNKFLVFLFSSNFPIPKIERVMQRQSTIVTAKTAINPSQIDFCSVKFIMQKKTGPIASWRNNPLLIRYEKF